MAALKATLGNAGRTIRLFCFVKSAAKFNFVCEIPIFARKSYFSGGKVVVQTK
jgi:hypothetical protein